MTQRMTSRMGLILTSPL